MHNPPNLSALLVVLGIVGVIAAIVMATLAIYAVIQSVAALLTRRREGGRGFDVIPRERHPPGA
jgi:hypothetical protein